MDAEKRLYLGSFLVGSVKLQTSSATSLQEALELMEGLIPSSASLRRGIGDERPEDIGETERAAALRDMGSRGRERDVS